MNKKIIALAVGVALAGSVSVASANPCAAKDTAGVSGFVDVVYTVSNEARDDMGTNPDTGANDVNDVNSTFAVDGEIDFVSTMGDAAVRIDLDVMGSSSHVEQANLAWGINDALTLVAGVFNNPMTADHHDKPDMSFTSHSATYNVIASQGASDVAGVALAGAVGPATVTLGLLNDLGGADEENSIVLMVNGSPMENLDLELGYVTQSDNTGATTTATTAGNVLDINAAYSMNDFTVGFDYLTADNIVDNAYTLDAGYDAGNGFGLGLRLDSVAFTTETAIEDISATTVYASYAAADNLTIALEIKSGSDDNVAASAASAAAVAVSGIADGSLTTINLVSTF